MRFLTFIPLLLIVFLQICMIEPVLSLRNNKIGSAGTGSETAIVYRSLLEEHGMIIRTRILTPDGYRRTIAPPNTFESYLRNLPLKPHNTIPKMYNGRTVRRLRAYEAVVDLAIGDKNLHQCADAIIRLKAEFLFRQQQYDKIHFNFTNGFRVDYTEWMKGKRIVVKGNSSYWVQSSNASNTYQDLWQYLETIFMWAGTASLENELVPAPADDIKIGDILIQGGTPGHAMIIVDAAVHSDTGEKIFLLAQSNMPAQEIQVVKNLADREISPWFRISNETSIMSGRWTFGSDDLKRFSD